MSDTITTAQSGVSTPLHTRIWTLLMAAAERAYETSAAARCAREAAALHQLSDEELAARGLKRDQIVAHAFRDLPQF